jgi:hypothetical protein
MMARADGVTGHPTRSPLPGSTRHYGADGLQVKGITNSVPQRSASTRD